eukprot:6893763-Pyramimonas_sp.AAC.1
MAEIANHTDSAALRKHDSRYLALTIHHVQGYMLAGRSPLVPRTVDCPHNCNSPRFPNIIVT